MLGCSALHHAVQRPVSPPIQLLLRRLDHTSIYVFIAGSYTPVCIVGGLHPFWSKIMLSVVWALAGAGVYQKLFLDLGSKARYLTISTYLLQGWCCVAMMPQLVMPLIKHATKMGIVI
jgi:hemolysin III